MHLPYKHIIPIYSRNIQNHKYTLGNMQSFYVKQAMHRMTTVL